MTRLVSSVGLAITRRSVYRLHCIFLRYLNSEYSMFFDKQTSDYVKCFRFLLDSDINILAEETMTERVVFSNDLQQNYY